ncbi:hypothetical protein GGR28_001913 [Lewinella aquimaris]|uniref:Flippase-like domain-containing protein n=1 Tax=Neolewinella aquimaris TaxID=1835722 RepID=A0A840E5Q6_9BACT|nr:lysylphosphatidylglycerol synthase transmembrane domain-containing protein [Neolewinella aquimaris]MBB4079293.1 hypothetical protein [Neolewinella aquimaris]
MSQSVSNTLKFLVFVGLGFGILYLVYRNQQAAYAADCALRGIAGDECSLLDKVLRDFRGANFWWLGMTLIAFCISNVSRALRWNMLLRTLGKTPRFINAFLTINLGYLANLGFPRFGEIVRPAAMARYENIKLERVVGTVVVDRMVDVVSLLALTGLTLLIAGDRIWAWVDENASISDRLAGLEWLLTSAVILAVGGLALAWFQRRRILATRLGAKVVTIIQGFGEGIRTIATVQHPGLFVLYSLNIWFMYFLMTYFVFLSFAPTAGLGPEAALTTFVSGGWGIVVPSPGGMGSYHYMAQSALGLYGLPGEDGFSWANISFFSINIGCNVLIGLLALLLLPRINRSYTPS